MSIVTPRRAETLDARSSRRLLFWLGGISSTWHGAYGEVCGEGSGEGCKDAEGRPTARARMHRTWLLLDLVPCPELFRGRFVCASDHRVRMRMRASSDGLCACCLSGAAWRGGAGNGRSYCRVAECAVQCQVVGVVKRLLSRTPRPRLARVTLRLRRAKDPGCGLV
jgi:hypothetical protein